MNDELSGPTMERTVAGHLKSCCLALVAAAVLFSGSAMAGSVTVDQTENAINVGARDVTIDEVLAHIGRLEGFEVERAGEPPAATMSGRFSGPPIIVIARILENQSYVIIHAPTSKIGISRLLLLGTGELTLAPSTAPSTAVPTAQPTPSASLTDGTLRPSPLPREIVGPAPTINPMIKHFRR